MTNREKMIKYMAKVEETMELLATLSPVIRREVEQNYGRKIRAARTQQEQDNLRQHYTILVGRENIWKQTYLSDRDLYIRLATMYGVAAQVEQDEATHVTEAF